MPQHDIDIRVFSRYPKQVRFTLNHQGRALPARTVDYSLNSLGVVIEDPVTLDTGDTLDLEIDELDIHQKGQIVWIKKDDRGARMGIMKLGTLNGSLRDYPLPDLLIGFQRTLKTGILLIRQGTVNKKVYIRNGDIIYSDSNQDEDRIGDILLREGKMTRKQYDHAAERKRRTNERYVLILVDSGFLGPADLLSVVELQATRIIEGLFLLRQAEFEFIEGPLPCETPISLRLSVADLIYREVKKTADIERLRKYLLDSIPVFSPTPLNLFQNIRLCDSDRTLLSYVDGKTPVAEIIRLSSMDAAATLRSFHALLETRILEVKERGENALGLTPPEVFSGGDASYCELIDKIDGMHQKYRQLDYYGLLDIDRHASSQEIKKAYFRAAKEYHPDMHVDLPCDIKEKLVNIFSCINNAYLTLKDYEKRVEYDRSADQDAAPNTSTEESSGCIVTQNSPAQEQRPEAPSGPDFSRNAAIAQAKYEEGRTNFRKERIEEAANLFASAIYFDSSRPEYHYFYGFALEKLDKLKESMQSLYRAYEMAPNNADIVAAIGHVYLKLGCPLRAKGNFERALKIEPSHKRAAQGMETINESREPGR
ncbi:MAG: DUF4388 domain-containing protein [Thermodesulfovibrionales bacterium]